MSESKRVKIINNKNSRLVRVLVFRSNKFIYAQAINDANGTIIASVSSVKDVSKITPVEKSKKVGTGLAKLLLPKYKQVVFDRGSYQYHGQVRALADGLREGGIKI